MVWKVVCLLALALAGPELQAESTEPSQPAIQGVQRPASLIGDEAGEALLKGRVSARWQALIKGDFEAAYQFETPAYRAIYTPSQFRYQFGNQILWRMASVKSIHYDDPIVARVRVDVAYHYAEPEKGLDALNATQEVNEVWLRKESQWWHQRH